MKKIALLLLLFAVGFQLQAQLISVPVNPTTKDQVVQGPCYVFATTAALESRSLQAKCSTPNLSDWYFYSECVLGGYLSGSNVIPKILEHTRDYGAVRQFDHFMPLGGASTCANPNDPLVPCLFDLASNSFCDPDFCRNGETFMGGQTCQGANSNNYFEPNVAPYVLNIAEVNGQLYQPIALGANPSQQLRNALFQGYGVIAGFQPNGLSNRPNNHGVFIYGYDIVGGQVTWYYKDSWPGDAGLKTAVEGVDIHLGLLNFAGYVIAEVPFDVPCEDIQGPVDLYLGCSGQYSIPGVPACLITWEMSNNLNLDGELDEGVIISSNPDPMGDQAYIIARYGNCEVYFQVNLITANPLFTPAGITTIDTDWNNGFFCPDQIIDFEVDDPFNPPFPSTSYDWEVQGGTILYGQGTPILTTKTGNGGTMTVKVRATLDGCPVSDQVSTNASKNLDCDSGGDIEGFTVIGDQETGMHINGSFLVFDALGRKVAEGRNEDLGQSMRHLNAGVYFLSTMVEGELQTYRVLKR